MQLRALPGSSQFRVGGRNMTPTILPFRDFDLIYQKAVESVWQYWTPEMQNELATHCSGWRQGAFDFKRYLEASAIRYYYAYVAIVEENPHHICDIGSLWGVFAVTLKSLGYDVTVTEALQYYSDGFQPLFEYIAARGIIIKNYDPFQKNSILPEKFDFITAMAILEHYPHSLKDFMDNVTAMLSPKGVLYLEVPNIAYWPKRIDLLLGRSPLPDVKDIYFSKIPYIGHHHEFTMEEFKDLAELSGLSVLREGYYTYSENPLTIKKMLRNPLKFMAYLLLKDSRECLTLLCKLKDK
jgi:2-polyprenyl-3-methyl-5-hydroxy-6-metoxy-1,4-benzoquinol methylase